LVLLMCSLFSLVLLGFLIDFHLLSATSKSLVFWRCLLVVSLFLVKHILSATI
jgi:hypothetical protein